MKNALAAVARHVPACTFTAGGLGCFPNLRRPRVVWVGVDEPAGRLEALQSAIEEVMTPFGYPPEKRGFSPHLTLGRMGRRASRDDAAQVGEVVASTTIEPLAEVTADGFALIRSILKPTGAEYTTLHEFPLEG
jgi:2'-5' RNA ligase